MAGGVSASPERSEKAAPWRGHSMRSPFDPAARERLQRVGADVVHREDLAVDVHEDHRRAVDVHERGLAGGEVGHGRDVDEGALGHGQPSFSRTASSSSARSSSSDTCSRTSWRKPMTISRLAAASGTPRERR